MATRTWNGSNGSFTTATDWLPDGTVPQPGDVAVIDSGTVAITLLALEGLVLQVDGVGPSLPSVVLTNAGVDQSTTDVETNANPYTGFGPVVQTGLVGAVVNRGHIVLTGGPHQFNLASDSGGGQGFLNTGTIDVVSSRLSMTSSISAPGATIENDGMVASWTTDASAPGYTQAVNDTITGTGVWQIGPHTTLDLNGAVGPGQEIDFTGGAGAGASLTLDQEGQFQGTIVGFAQGDAITLSNGPYSSYAWDGPIVGSGPGTLVLMKGSEIGASIRFSHLTGMPGVAAGFVHTYKSVYITTGTTPAQNFRFTNTLVNLSGTDTGIVGTGGASGVQTYRWVGSDPVAAAADIANVAMTGSAGVDALAASSGVNVLDGGAGSSFLVGGTGAGSQDTFVVDAGGGAPTWSTVVNFQSGDVLTVHGFEGATSALNLTPSDGVAGYTGLTIHAPNGGGPGVDASITFAGITQATSDGHFSYATVGAELQVRWDH